MKKRRIKGIKCPHYKGDGYGYQLNENLTLNLCDVCNLILAGEIAKQAMLETFLCTIQKNKNSIKVNKR